MRFPSSSASGQTLMPVLLVIAAICVLIYLGNQLGKIHKPGFEMTAQDIVSTTIVVDAKGGADFSVHLTPSGSTRLRDWSRDQGDHVNIVFGDNSIGEVKSTAIQDGDTLHFSMSPTEASQDRYRIGK